MVGVEEVFVVFADVDWIFVVLLFLVAIPMIWISCVKWLLFIRASGYDAPIGHLMRLYTIGYFFNSFTPSYVGGDIARSVHLGQFIKSQRDALIATFLERFTGLLAMSMLGAIFVACGAEATAGVEAAILIVAGGVILTALVFFSKKAAEFTTDAGCRVLHILCGRHVAEKFLVLSKRARSGLERAQSDFGLFCKAMLLSFAFHILTIINTYLAARAIGWDNPSLGGLFIVVPLVLLVGMAPVTPGGLGIQEGAFYFFLQRVGASSAQALSVGLILRAKVVVIAMLGGLLWLGIRGVQSPKTTNLKTTADFK